MNKLDKAPIQAILEELYDDGYSQAKIDRTPDGDEIIDYKNKDIARAEQAIQQEIDRAEKAFGGCKKCYGKGYATVRKGNTYHGKTYDLKTHLIFCTCERGKQLEELLEARLEALRKQTITNNGGKDA
jgi:hypothetical protein